MIVDQQGIQSRLSASVQSQGFETVSETISISPDKQRHVLKAGAPNSASA
jgi:hypothetical protein